MSFNLENAIINYGLKFAFSYPFSSLVSSIRAPIFIAAARRSTHRTRGTWPESSWTSTSRPSSARSTATSPRYSRSNSVRRTQLKLSDFDDCSILCGECLQICTSLVVNKWMRHYLSRRSRMWETFPTSVSSRARASHVSMLISAINTPGEGCTMPIKLFAVDMEICKRYAIARVPSVLLILVPLTGD